MVHMELFIFMVNGKCTSWKHLSHFLWSLEYGVKIICWKHESFWYFFFTFISKIFFLWSSVSCYFFLFHSCYSFVCFEIWNCCLWKFKQILHDVIFFTAFSFIIHSLLFSLHFLGIYSLFLFLLGILLLHLFFFVFKWLFLYFLLKV